MESSLTQRRGSLEEKIPDIKKTLDMVEYLLERRVRVHWCLFNVALLMILQEGKGKAEDEDLEDLEEDESKNKPLTTTFELNDTLFAEAELEDTDTVYLWLGVCLHKSDFVQNADRNTGKCDVIIQASCRHRSTSKQAGGCANQFGQHYRGSRVSERTTYHHGSEHRSCLQLRCQTQTREKRKGTEKCCSKRVNGSWNMRARDNPDLSLHFRIPYSWIHELWPELGLTRGAGEIDRPIFSTC